MDEFLSNFFSTKRHVKRLWAVNPLPNGIYDGSRLENAIDPDLWIDVLRYDRFPLNVSQARDGTTALVEFIYKWLDGNDKDSLNRNMPLVEVANGTRTTYPIAIFDQSQELDEIPQLGDDGTVPLNLIKSLRQSTHGAFFIASATNVSDGQSNRDITTIYKNEEYKRRLTDRKTYTMRVPHNDLAEGAEDAIDMTSHPVSWETYLAALKAGQQDPSQYIDMELVKNWTFTTRGNPDGTAGEFYKFNYSSGFIKTMQSLFRCCPTGGRFGDNPYTPFRLDPLQIIVNVSLGGLAVEFFDKSSGDL